MNNNCKLPIETEHIYNLIILIDMYRLSHLVKVRERMWSGLIKNRILPVTSQMCLLTFKQSQSFSNLIKD